MRSGPPPSAEGRESCLTEGVASTSGSDSGGAGGSSIRPNSPRSMFSPATAADCCREVGIEGSTLSMTSTEVGGPPQPAIAAAAAATMPTGSAYCSSSSASVGSLHPQQQQQQLTDVTPLPYRQLASACSTSFAARSTYNTFSDYSRQPAPPSSSSPSTAEAASVNGSSAERAAQKRRRLVRLQVDAKDEAAESSCSCGRSSGSRSHRHRSLKKAGGAWCRPEIVHFFRHWAFAAVCTGLALFCGFRLMQCPSGDISGFNSARFLLAGVLRQAAAFVEGEKPLIKFVGKQLGLSSATAGGGYFSSGGYSQSTPSRHYPLPDELSSPTLSSARRVLQEAEPSLPPPAPRSPVLWDRLVKFERSGVVDSMVRDSAATKRLIAHNAEFPKIIEHVCKGVYVAVGYGLANVVLIDLPRGYILIDTLESGPRMRELMEDWQKLHSQRLNMVNSTVRVEPVQPASPDVSADGPQYRWGKPVLAIFYSHFHADHVFGAGEVYDPSITQVWAHELTAIEIEKVFSVVAGTTYKRSMRQFGTLLTEEDGYINAGIGPKLHYTSHTEISATIAPTHTWSGNQTVIEIGGLRMEWRFAPGESKDQCICWLPELKVLFAADNVYKAWPNIYAIRGTESRDPMVWVRTLDMLRTFDADHMILGHTLPVAGRANIQETLTIYRDAIQYVHDQTVRRMNEGLDVDEIVRLLKLPPHMAEHPWLEEFYGTFEWTTRAVFHHYVGWFSGAAEDLNPLSKQQRALRLRALAGSHANLVNTGLEALERGDYQWSLEISSYARLLDPGDVFARRVRILALKALASGYVSAPGRNWMLTTAKEEMEELRELEGLAAPLAAANGRHSLLSSSLFAASSGGQKHRRRHHQQGAASAASNTSSVGDQTAAAAVAAANDLSAADGAEDSSLLQTGTINEPPLSMREGLTITMPQRVHCIQSLRSPVETFGFLPTRLKAEKALKLDTAVLFKFTDTQEQGCVHFRRGVAYTKPECEKPPTLTVETTDKVWRKIVSKQISPVVAVTTGRFRLVPLDPLGYLRLKYIMSLVDFETDNV